MEAVELAGVGHYVEGEIEGAAPDVFDFGGAQLRVNGEHTAAEDFSAAADGAAGFGEEGGASAEEHAAVRREAVVVEIVFGVEDHAIARTEFGGKFFGQCFRDDDVRADRDYFLLQRGSDAAGVAASGDQDVFGAQSSS